MSAYQIPANLMVDGIRSIKEIAAHNATQIQVPPEFDRKNYSYKWEIKGHKVEAARQPQPIQGAPGNSVQGWEVCVRKGTKNKIVEHPLESGPVLILMRRPKHISTALNAIYGDISKRRSNAEQQGETVSTGGDARGMLTNRDWERAERSKVDMEPIYSGGAWNSVDPNVIRASARSTSKK